MNEWTPEGPHSYWVSLTIGTAIVAATEEDAKQRLLDVHVKQLPMTGWDSYGKVEWAITPGPPIHSDPVVSRGTHDDGSAGVVPETS